ncbi:MAG: hypothetical protein RL410_313 [Actinomycetota bacterium]|jgi:uncharacterized protein (TIGR01777 family)
MRILISGGSGLIGSALTPFLESQGHEVVSLVRRPSRNRAEITWNPARHEIPENALDGIDAIINLSGAGVGDRRWTKSYKQQILQSRLDATNTLVNAINKATHKPKILLNGSAIGFYGDRGEEHVTEESPRGNGFLAEVVEQWEAAALNAASTGVRVALLRTGLVLTPKGGAFAKLLPLFKLGLGGTIAGGKQFWSIISLTDEVRAIEFALSHEIHGPVNLTIPQTSRNREVTKSLAKLLKRPALLPVPGFALHLVLGEFASDITTGAAVVPGKLQSAGFIWKHATVEAAIAAEVLGQHV